MRKLIIAGVLVVAAIPAVAVAAGGTFADDDDSIFESSIEWLAASGVTAGCNPPTNDNFCPNDNVTRGQMAAFMQRFAAYLGAEDGIVSKADNAAAVGGVPSAEIVTHGDIVMTHSTSQLTPNSVNPPTTLNYYPSGNIVSGDGLVILGINGPMQIGGVEYGLKSVEYCIENLQGGAFVNAAFFDEEGPWQGGDTDGTDRTEAGCYTLDVNRSGSHGYAVSFALGGGASASLRISGATSTWVPVADLAAAEANERSAAATGR